MTGPGLFAAQAEMLQKKASCGVSDAWLDKKKEDFRQQQRKVREAPPKKKRENVGILKKQGGGVYPNPTSFVI